MGQGVLHDVVHMLIGELVDSFPAGTLNTHRPRNAQDAEMLRDEGLAHPRLLAQGRDRQWSLPQLLEDRQPGGRAEDSEELCGRGQLVGDWHASIICQICTYCNTCMETARRVGPVNRPTRSIRARVHWR